MTSELTNRRVLLRRRPEGRLVDDDVEIVEESVPVCEDGQVLLRWVWLGLDATVRSALDEGGGFLPAIELGDPIRSAGLARVIESRHPRFEVGMWAGGVTGWEEWSVHHGESRMVNPWPGNIDPLLQIAVLNGPGPDAWFGLNELAHVAETDTVLVTGAAGATGSLAVQVARNLGASVIGIANDARGCRWVEELGAESCLDRRTQDLDGRLRELRPRGVEVCFDNVGGEVLDVALRRIGDGARVVICGSESAGSAHDRQPGPSSYLNLATRGATMSGLRALDFLDRFPDAQKILRRWHDEDLLQYRVDLADGLERGVRHLDKLLTGAVIGKPVIRVCDDPEPTS